MIKFGHGIQYEISNKQHCDSELELLKIISDGSLSHIQYAAKVLIEKVRKQAYKNRKFDRNCLKCQVLMDL